MLKIMKASAGSGKTYSLARTYIGLLLRSSDRYAYRHILAVTFTNKATDEMKNRILKELHIMAAEPSKSNYRNDFVPSVFPSLEDMQEKAGRVLHDILHDYSAFAVSTIDRFFQQTLKAFSREIGQFASYQVELDKNSLVSESVDRMLDSLTEDSGGLLDWLTENVLEQIEQGERYSMDANLLDMAVRLKSSQRQEAMERAGIREEDIYSKENLKNIRSICREITDSFRKEVRLRARTALDVLEKAGVNPADSNRGFMSSLYVYDELKDSDQIKRPTDSFLSKSADCEQWFAKSKAAKLLPLVYPALSDPMDAFRSLWEKDFAVYNTACILDGQIYGLGVAAELHRNFNELMKEKNVLCIEDSNTILRDIIDGSDTPFVYEKLGVRFEHFLLDEFQDTAQVQWTNFSPLLHNSDAQGGENLIVGDVKQSIYRWRGSDWNLLDSQIPEEFPDHVDEVLDTNFRSLPAVVEFNNMFFRSASEILDTLSGHECDGPMIRIYSDVVQNVARKGGQEGCVSLTFCARDNELDQVLEAVSEAVDAGAGYSDIAVLVRSNLIGSEVSSYLIDNGIPVITDDSLKVKSSITVRRIVSLMSCVDNPDNTVNGFLAKSLEIDLPQRCCSLIDMAEAIIRSLQKNGTDGFREGEVLHVQSFMDCLQDYVAAEGNSLRGFLKHWEGENPSISSPSEGNSVRVMTIHKSKGLDFPYVIIPFAENITLYKAGSSWCAPQLKGTDLEGIAEGVYDVVLSGNTESTLFADHYRRERFLQQVDNINTLYVAMTRASMGMHIIAKTPSSKVLDAVKEGLSVQFSDFSQMLYSFAENFGMTRADEDGSVTYVFGKTLDFNGRTLRQEGDVAAFPVVPGMEYPSVPLNPHDDTSEGDVRERGRLKFSADAVDFFTGDGQVGIEASNRIRGIVLHDILAEVRASGELDRAVRNAVMSGVMTSMEAHQVKDLLSERLRGVEDYGWFADNGASVLNEVNIIDTDGRTFRPDRVMRSGNKITVVDYKFGEHYPEYESQMRRYADIWRRMGYSDVSAYLWYVQTGEVRQVEL